MRASMPTRPKELRLRRICWTLPLVVAFSASMLGAPPAEAKARTVTIQAGAVHPTHPSARYDFTRYYPDVLKVRRGQTVRWTFPINHTVTFSKSPRPGFYRPDEVSGTYALNERVGFGAAGCGREGLRPCVLTDRTPFLSSGLAPLRANEPFEVTIDAPAGRYRYFCTIHPGMRGTIEVVPPRATVPTQRQVDAEIKAEVRKDARAADAVFRAGQKPVSRVTADGTREWRVLLTDATPDDHVSLFAFMPSELKIAPGDKVRYVFRDRAVNGVHTVTFPTALAGGSQPVPHGLAGLPFTPACDLDGRSTGLKGVPGLWGVNDAWPACPGDVELLWQPWMIQGHPAPGNEVRTAATYHDSGFLVPKRSAKGIRTLPDTKRVFPSSFEAVFPSAGGFSYSCNFHPDFMTGNVSVS